MDNDTDACILRMMTVAGSTRTTQVVTYTAIIEAALLKTVINSEAERLCRMLALAYCVTDKLRLSLRAPSLLISTETAQKKAMGTSHE